MMVVARLPDTGCPGTGGPDKETSDVPQLPLVEPLRRWDPEQIGGFVLIGRLGAGAMGRVYLGRSAAGRLVAVKTIRAELAEEPDFRNRFGQEVAAARRVSGAFTAAVVAADAEADVPWLATVYVPAPSLRRLVRSCGPVPVPAVRWLAAGCAEALESIHSVGLVHRDLKPANVLVSPDGPRVIDFGVARAAERIQLTVTRGSVGTPAYMAPEQARDNRQATFASDIFALGATMAFAATGHAPYHGETVMDVLVQLATGPPDLTGLPSELAGLVGACLERDPRNRPTSASILAQLAPELAGDAGTPPLPAAARELIEDYRRVPTTVPGRADVTVGERAHADGNGVSEDHDTLGSQPADPPWPRPAQRPAGAAGPEPDRSARPESAPPRSARLQSAPQRPRRRAALAAAAAVAAAALVAAGWGLHAAAGPASRSPGQLAAGATGAGALPASSPQFDGRPAQDESGLGPVLPMPSGVPPPGAVVPLPGETPSVISLTQAGRFIALSQAVGDGETGFVIHGGNWPPGEILTVVLVGVGQSPDHPVADRAGTFNYTINQAGEFFRHQIPPGTYTVQVTGEGGRRATARFRVISSA